MPGSELRDRASNGNVLPAFLPIHTHGEDAHGSAFSFAHGRSDTYDTSVPGSIHRGTGSNWRILRMVNDMFLRKIFLPVGIAAAFGLPIAYTSIKDSGSETSSSEATGLWDSAMAVAGGTGLAAVSQLARDFGNAEIFAGARTAERL